MKGCHFYRRSLLGKLVAILSIAGFPLLGMSSSPAAARVEVVIGEYAYRFGDSESLKQARELCKSAAYRNVLESAMVFVKSDIRLTADGLSRLDVSSTSVGILKEPSMLEERSEDHQVYCRVRASVDIVQLEKMLLEAAAAGRINPARKYTIRFYAGEIRKGLEYSLDDSNPAPDAYILVRDQYGNEICNTGAQFMMKQQYGRLLKNRNNYNPNFEGTELRYTFSADSALYVHLVDWDGLEGFMGKRKSQDDIIGPPHVRTIDLPLGRKWIGNGVWRLEVEINQSD